MRKNSNVLEVKLFHETLQVLTLSYSSKINGYFYHQRVSPPLKKRSDTLSEGNAAHPFGCDSLWSIVMAVWRSFCFNSNFLGRVRQPSAENNGEPRGHYYLQRAVTSDQITLQNSLQRAGGP
jgi:hypothetical protein